MVLRWPERRLQRKRPLHLPAVVADRVWPDPRYERAGSEEAGGDALALRRLRLGRERQKTTATSDGPYRGNAISQPLFYDQPPVNLKTTLATLRLTADECERLEELAVGLA